MFKARTIVIGLMLAIAAPDAVSACVQSDLRDRVQRAVGRSGQVTIFDDVRVTTDGWIVTLSGRVTHHEKQLELLKVTAGIEGVARVVDDIAVLSESPIDIRLRRNIAETIYRHPTFWHYAGMPAPPIHIIVEHRRVWLIGSVDNRVERQLAEALARVEGVRAITNELDVIRRFDHPRLATATMSTGIQWSSPGFRRQLSWRLP